MEKINRGEELPKKGRGRSRKNDQIVKTLDTSESLIPNWKVFNIKEIAEIDPLANKMLTLKNVKTNKNGEKYIEINGRKYYEFNGEGASKDSIYIQKGNSIFIGDRFEGLTNRDGVLFRYSIGIGGGISFEQRKTKYSGGAMHLQQIYKSEIFSASEVIGIVKYSGKLIKITKDLVDDYIAGGLKKTAKDIVETAIRLNPSVSKYVQNLKEK